MDGDHKERHNAQEIIKSPCIQPAVVGIQNWNEIRRAWTTPNARVKVGISFCKLGLFIRTHLLAQVQRALKAAVVGFSIQPAVKRTDFAMCGRKQTISKACASTTNPRKS